MPSTNINTIDTNTIDKSEQIEELNVDITTISLRLCFINQLADYVGAGMLSGKFLKESNLGVAQALFDP